LKGNRGRGAFADEKPPILGMLQRNGEVVIAMLPNVQRATIELLIQQTIQIGSRVYTDDVIPTITRANPATPTRP
jgi:transposase